MTDYLAAGMIMTPTNPTYTEQRDAILAAAAASDENDLLLLAQGFARGLGITEQVTSQVDGGASGRPRA